MKNYKLFALLLSFTVLLTSMDASAQTRVKTVKPIVQGNYGVLGTSPNTISGTGTADTLQVSDTIAYIVPITGQHCYIPFLSIGWTKISAGTATLTANFYQGNSTSNFTTVKAGAANAAYTKTLTLSASGTNFVDFLADSAKVSGRYLKIEYRTSNTASVKGSINTVVQTAIK